MNRRTAVMLFLLFLGGAFVLTHLPGNSLPDVDVRAWLPAADKWVHGGLYFCLAGCLANYLRFFIRSNRIIVVVTLVSLATYAAFDEWSQQFAPSRTPDLYDFVADMIGASLGVSSFAVWRWLRRQRRRLSESAAKSPTADSSQSTKGLRPEVPGERAIAYQESLPQLEPACTREQASELQTTECAMGTDFR